MPRKPGVGALQRRGKGKARIVELRRLAGEGQRGAKSHCVVRVVAMTGAGRRSEMLEHPVSNAP